MTVALTQTARSLGTWTSWGTPHGANDATVPKTSCSQRHHEIFATHDEEASECSSSAVIISDAINLT
jgi:hypothetical protein